MDSVLPESGEQGGCGAFFIPFVAWEMVSLGWYARMSVSPLRLARSFREASEPQRNAPHLISD
jgi:hypothetical protein